MVPGASRELSCTQRTPAHHTRATRARARSQTAVLRVGSAVSAPRPQAPPVAACHRRPCRALHVVPCRSCEPSGSRPITAATPAELLRSLRRGRAVRGRCALIHCWCEHVPRAHQMAAKRSAERRPSALLRHGQAARGQYWSLVRLPHRAAAVAACASSGAGSTSWTAEDAAAPWTDGPLPEVVGRLLWSNEDLSRKSGHATRCA